MTPKHPTFEEYMVEPRHEAVRSTVIEEAPVPYEASNHPTSQEFLQECDRIISLMLPTWASPIDTVATQEQIDQLLSE